MKGKMIDEEKLTLAKLGRFDKFMLKILRAGSITVHQVNDESVNAQGVIFLYWRTLRNYPLAIIISILGVIIGSVSAVATPYLFKQFLDALANPVQPSSITTLMNYVFMLFAVSTVSWAGWRVSYFSMAYLASNVIAELRKVAFSHLIHHSHSFFSTSFTGSLVQKVNRFANSYDRLADRFVFDIIPIIIQVTGIMFVLFGEHPVVAYIILAWITIFLLWNYSFAIWKLKFDISRAAQDSRSTGQLADSITNHQTIELYRSYKQEELMYAKQVELQAKYQRFSWQSSSMIDGVQSFLIVVVEFVLLYVGVQLWVKGQLSIGAFVLIQTYIIQLTDRLWSFSRMIRDVYESFADAKEMAEIIYKKHDIIDAKESLDSFPGTGGIDFKHVAFTFHNKQVINDLDLSIKPGEKVALVGRSGAGKTTIIRLLFRQYDVDRGSIMIDGVDIRMIKLESLGELLSMVPQEPLLFNRSLMENIRYARPNASDEEVIAAAKHAHCHEFIISHPQGYSSLVGERGIKLSGGERQRIAIARAFLRNSRVLVLDEATSSLDSESESYIQDSLSRLMSSKTTIVIAHRLSTIKRMDRIIVIDNGKVAASGTHDELIKVPGAYKRLWEIQQGGFIKDDDELVDEKVIQ